MCFGNKKKMGNLNSWMIIFLLFWSYPIVVAIASSSSSLDPTSAKPLDSRCFENETYVYCSHNILNVSYEFGTRQVYYQIPLGSPPVNGWPVVFFFQGSFYKAEWAFWSYSDSLFGAWYQTHVLKGLLDNGFAILAPNADYYGLYPFLKVDFVKKYCLKKGIFFGTRIYLHLMFFGLLHPIII